MDDAKLDLRNMGVKKWKTRAVYRTEWHVSRGKPRPNLKGLQCWRRRNCLALNV
jgi:hypothetical protein